MVESSNRPLGLITVSVLTTALGFPAAADVTLSDGDNFSGHSGEALYANVCAACHMDHGQGATGAGRYPALAENQNLAAGTYPVYVVLHGYKGMPPVGQMMSDEQVAAVVNYVRANFGNDYADKVTHEDVATSR
ncbi:c-type cytochrome [Rhizobium gallicum]|uniref:c-type cytochrome n=1 Tax=Rhizobium gallicum TaxID=56730 RepID=UPI001EF8E5D2|nr:cytochrome c [Rhizobium gallicum]ULJ74288.1 cytochrome c [Rhizobium gallicum]